VCCCAGVFLDFGLLYLGLVGALLDCGSRGCVCICIANGIQLCLCVSLWWVGGLWVGRLVRCCLDYGGLVYLGWWVEWLSG